MNKGVIKYRIEVCEPCRSANREHAWAHMNALWCAEYRLLRLPTDCGCLARVVGDCAICRKPARELGIAGERHMDVLTAVGTNIVGINGTPSPASSPTITSICGHCVTKLAVTFTDPANIPVIQAIIDACQPKVVTATTIPQGAAKVGPFPVNQ